jgi:hypothetical protein
MFVRYFVEIDRPASDVEADLLAAPAAWSSGPALEAEARGQSLLSDVGFESAWARVDKRVEITFGEPVRFPTKTALPMSWKAAGLEVLFPNLDADIEVAALGPARTQLSISGRYTPPLGPVGKMLDRTSLHRVAEATVKDFLDRAAAILARSDRHAAVSASPVWED